jgi:hypothetical protein
MVADGRFRAEKAYGTVRCCSLGAGISNKGADVLEADYEDFS